MTRQELPKGMMAILNYGAMEEKYVFEPMAEECGYKRKTTFFSDLSIAECYGVKGIKDKYKCIKESWGNNVEFWTEFTMAVNWKSHEWCARGDDEFCELYTNLYLDADDYACKQFKGADIKYYLRTTD